MGAWWRWKRSLCLTRRRNLLLAGLGFVLIAGWFFNRTEKTAEYKIDMYPGPYTSLAQCDRLPNDTGFNCPDIRRKGITKLRQAQLVLTRMLRIFDLIARKHGIRYWLYRGTLIGAARHRGHNPFDNDVDICILQEDYDVFVKYGANDLPDDVFFQTEQTDPYYETPSCSGLFGKLRDTSSCYKNCLGSGCLVDGLQIDMFVVQRDSDGNLLELFSHNNYFLRLFYGPIVRRHEDVFPLQEMNFDGFPVPVPKAWSDILTSLYGDFMKIPSGKKPAHSHTETLLGCDQIMT